MKIIEKIFRDKKANPVIYIILAVGILMLVLSNSLSQKNHSVRETSEIRESNDSQSELEKILSDIESVGEVSVMISTKTDKTENEKTVESVLVVADGGDNTAVREKIIRAVKAALGVESHKIEVFERKEKQ